MLIVNILVFSKYGTFKTLHSQLSALIYNKVNQPRIAILFWLVICNLILLNFNFWHSVPVFPMIMYSITLDLICRGCHVVLGMVFTSTPKQLDHKRFTFCFNVADIDR